MNDGPQYVDLQLNGYAGVDFNADRLDPQAVATACARLRSDGVAHALATIITAPADDLLRRLRNLCDVRRADPLIADVLCGFHVEGPFLNPAAGYIGAHPREAACPADPELTQRLLEAGEGLVRIVTLAPECDPGLRVTRLLVRQGVRVAAGHCDPSLDQLRAALDEGLSLFTHLGNGCPLQLHRHDNIIQRALSLSERLHIGFIADGVHVPCFALKNYLRAAGLDRAFVVTDAIQAAGQGPGRFRLGDREVVVDENLATWAADRSHLVGSACTMPQAVAQLKSQVGLSDAEVHALVCDNPRRILAIP